MRILLIEDDTGDARLIREMLSETNGGAAEMEWEQTLASGLERLASERFEVLLLDLTLPDSLGLDTLQSVHPFEQNALRLSAGSDASGSRKCTKSLPLRHWGAGSAATSWGEPNEDTRLTCD